PGMRDPTFHYGPGGESVRGGFDRVLLHDPDIIRGRRSAGRKHFISLSRREPKQQTGSDSSALFGLDAMKMAYLILAHNTPNHLSRLVRALDSANAAFFIHVDRKFDISRFRDGVPQHNVRFLENRVAVYWGEFSIVQATTSLMREALSRSQDPQYLCLLSGSDYPLRNPRYIESFFSRNQGREFINLVPMPCEAVGKPLKRLEDYWLQTPHDNQFVMRTVARLNALINNQLKLIKRDYKRAFNCLV